MSDPMRLVVDSSVAVKWFVAEGEAGVAEALALLDDHLSRRRVLAAPSHLLLEVLNALRSRGLGEPDLAAAARWLVGAQLELTPIERLVESAAVIAASHGLTVYDAAFAALACMLECELVTEDRRLAGSGACRARGLAGSTPTSLDLVTCGEDTD